MSNRPVFVAVAVAPKPKYVWVSQDAANRERYSGQSAAAFLIPLPDYHSSEDEPSQVNRHIMKIPLNIKPMLFPAVAFSAKLDSDGDWA
jgi:hypothetical protein